MYNALLQPPELICIYRIYCSEKQKSFCYSRGMRIIYFHPLCILFFFSSPGWYDFTHRIRCTFPMVYRQLNCVACITFEWHCHACMEFAGWSFVIHCWSWKYCFSVLEIEKKKPLPIHTHSIDCGLVAWYWPIQTGKIQYSWYMDARIVHFSVKFTIEWFDHVWRPTNANKTMEMFFMFH